MNKPTEIIMRPGMFLPVGVAHYAIGILCKKYPAKPGQKRFADQDAINKYGQDLFITVENIYREVLKTNREATVQVRWNADGSPELTVTKRSMIIMPSAN